MAANLTNQAALIQPRYAPGFVEAAFRNNHLLRHFGEPRDSGGDTSFRWLLNTDTNDSVQVFTEGLAQPDTGNQSWVAAAVPYTHFRFMIGATGHARAALRSNYVNGIDEEMTLGMRDLIHLINLSFMGSTYGIEVAVDSTSAYAGLTRGAITYFESLETAVNRKVAATDMQDLFEGLVDNDRGADPDMMIIPWNQNTNIYNLTGVPGVQMIGDSDKNPGLTGQMFNGTIPYVPLPNWTNTVLVMLDRSGDKWPLIEHEPFTVKFQGRSADSDVNQVSWRGSLVCKDPLRQGKLTGLTA
jgi:hypothetical protein